MSVKGRQLRSDLAAIEKAYHAAHRIAKSRDGARPGSMLARRLNDMHHVQLDAVRRMAVLAGDEGIVHLADLVSTPRRGAAS